MSLTQQLKTYFRTNGDWINGAVAEDYGRSLTHRKRGVLVHFKASTVSRRLREAESGIDSKGKPCEKFLIADHSRGSVYYKYGKEDKKENPRLKIIELPDGSKKVYMI